MQPMIAQIQERLDQVPDHHLTDGGFSTKKDIEATAQMGTTVYTPVKEEAQQKAKGQDPFAPKKSEKPPVAQWRQRMGTAEAKQRYKLRGETAEWVNACMRNRGMQQFLVRGLAKVKAVVLWYVLAHNLLRAEALRAQKRAGGEIPCVRGGWAAAGQERPAGEQGSRSARRLAEIATTVFQKNSFTDEGRRTSLTKSHKLGA